MIVPNTMVLCEVISAVAAEEKESMIVDKVSSAALNSRGICIEPSTC